MEQKEIYIETERIIIRNFKQKDAEGLLEYLSHPRVNCFAGDRLCSREAAWAYMQYSPKDMLRYAVSLKKDDFIIGDVFALRENEDTYNVGWHFNKSFEGKGFACEAATRLLDYLFGRRAHGVSMGLWKMTISVPNAYANALVCAAKDVSKSL